MEKRIFESLIGTSYGLKNINNNEIEKSSNRKRSNEGKNLIIIIIIMS
jgi:hypothetical protein